MEAIGRSYRGLVEGLVDARARASLKGEFRMAQTMIQPVQNNPLKFAPNVDEPCCSCCAATTRRSWRRIARWPTASKTSRRTSWR